MANNSNGGYRLAWQSVAGLGPVHFCYMLLTICVATPERRVPLNIAAAIAIGVIICCLALFSASVLRRRRRYVAAFALLSFLSLGLLVAFGLALKQASEHEFDSAVFNIFIGYIVFYAAYCLLCFVWLARAVSAQSQGPEKGSG